VLAVAVLLVLVVAGVATWQVLDPGSADPATGAPAGGPTAGASSGTRAPAGFTTCGTMLCPAQPLCWAGVTSSSGRAVSPRDLDCAVEHRWETFAATSLPADVSSSHEDELMQRPDLAAICSAEVLAERSRDPAETAGWVRDAWPIEVPGTQLRLVHCLAAPEGRQATGSAFS
jgi:serine/threonine-protein kinase